MITNFNPILATDSYKVTHWPMLPDGTEFLYSYMESRGGPFSELVANVGLQYYLRTYLSVPITMDMIDEAEEVFGLHFGDKSVFNRAGFEHIVNAHRGYWPVRIKAAPEGLIVPPRNVLMTIENTDPAVPWVTNYLETLMLKLWYPITVATISREIKKIIHAALEKTGTPAALPFKLHDFGYRGVSSEESAMIGGFAHLVNFMGTDTLAALMTARRFYGAEMAGFSIPATEHMTMTAMGPYGESAQMERFLKLFGQNPAFPAIACVSDSYDIFNACKNLWGAELRGDVLGMKNMLVVRPDSGEPAVIVTQVVETLDEAFGHTVNDKGYKVLNNVRVIQGDGINIESIKAIIDSLVVRGWSIDNIAFGMGGALLQQCNRDTLRFAFKASSMVVNGQRRDIFKEPKTDNGKRSKRGRLKLMNVNGIPTTVVSDVPGPDLLQVVWENGMPVTSTTLETIRQKAAIKTDW